MFLQISQNMFYICNVNVKNLGRVLRDLREAKGLSLRDLADIADVGFDTIGRLERAETPNPGIGTLIALARALRVPPENLLKAYQGIDPDEARPPQADEIEAEAEKALEFLSQFIKSKKPPR